MSDSLAEWRDRLDEVEAAFLDALAADLLATALAPDIEERATLHDQCVNLAQSAPDATANLLTLMTLVAAKRADG